MLDSLYIAASGMKAEQEYIENISNNLANMNTTAYKKSQVNFRDLMYRAPLDSMSSVDALSGSSQVGLGASIQNISKVFEPGDLKATLNPMDIAINGKGFFEIRLENGELAYTRNGSLRTDKNGYLSTVSGFQLSSLVQLPPDASDMRISSDGVVEIKQEQGSAWQEVGRVELASFINPSELFSIGNGIYLATEQTGAAYYSEANQNGLGAIQQGFLETSNVELVEELMDLVVAQQAYQVNSQIIRSSDEMMQVINNLRR